MKRFFLVLGVLLLGIQAQADFIEVETNVNMYNFWDKNGKDVQKIVEIGSGIINANKLDKHVGLYMVRNSNIPNAHATFVDKTVNVYTGLLPYIDNDDELAYIMAHEMSHCMDFYDGIFKVTAMKFNSKAYETKADLIGIDMMAKAGYNPISAITITKKISGESIFDNWIFWSHPKASTRMMNMYKYIYKKYPWALSSEMTKNINYQNFLYNCDKSINEFKRAEKLRSKKLEDI